MDFYHKVNMSNQWRIGPGGFVDLNCGWYCQDALLSWYCTKNRLPLYLFKERAKNKKMSFGFNPENSLCYKINIPKDILKYKENLLRHGPLIVAGKVGLARTGFFCGFGHYVLAVGVKTKNNDIIIYDPLSVDFHNFRKAKPAVYKFDSFIKLVTDVYALNVYTIKSIQRN